MDQPLDPPEDPLLRQEEEAARAEAGEIGGPAPDEGVDEASRPLYEAGQGEQEGFEQAEKELIEAAQHEENVADPETDAFTPEAESDRSTAVYGEPDEEDVTEVIRDPREDAEDAGAAAGIAADR